MATRMHVRNQVNGDRVYADTRRAAMIGELLAATERGERDCCPQCSKIAVSYTEEGPEGAEIVLAECSECGWQGA